MERIIKQVHFQITRNCNLRCAFCGQWGKKGFFADQKGTPMSFEDWKRIIDELTEYRKKSKENICITVWGGEPLTSPYFDELLYALKENDFKTEVITNGVLLDKHLQAVRKFADRLYVSIDGPVDIHDRIRGKGVWEKTVSNLKMLKHENVTVMSVITGGLIEYADKFLDELDELDIKELLLQDMIGFTGQEIKRYKDWMRDSFGIDAKYIESWENNEKPDLSHEIDAMTDKSNVLKHNYNIIRKRHLKEEGHHCMSPFYHMHIAWNGDVMYCTDFYDFSAGNVKEEGIEDIFYNSKSELFRKKIVIGACPSCAHCSWKENNFLEK